MLAAILLDRENGADGADLQQKAKRIRGEAKERIGLDEMTLDGLSVNQINSIYDQSPKLRQSFRRILDIMTT